MVSAASVALSSFARMLPVMTGDSPPRCTMRGTLLRLAVLLHRMVSPVRGEVRGLTVRSNAGRRREHVVANLNPALWGCGAYFRYGNSTPKFSAIDSHVTQCAWPSSPASTTASEAGDWTTRGTYRWLNQLGIYQLSGTVRHWASRGPAAG